MISRFCNVEFHSGFRIYFYLTTACFKVLLFLWFFFFWFNKCKKEKKGRNNSWSPKISAAVVGLGIFGTLFFTNHLKLVNSIPVSQFFFQVFSFKCQRDKFTACFLFWKKKKKKLTVLIFYYLMANNQMKCSIIYKKNRDAGSWWWTNNDEWSSPYDVDHFISWK